MSSLPTKCIMTNQNTGEVITVVNLEDYKYINTRGYFDGVSTLEQMLTRIYRLKDYIQKQHNEGWDMTGAMSKGTVSLKKIDKKND